MLKKIVRFLLFSFLFLILLGFIAFQFIDQPLPNGTSGNEAEQYADEMLKALNAEGFDTLKTISFTFAGIHSYNWNREENQVEVSWEDQKVTLNLNYHPEDFSMIEYEAYEYFINDSFWLVAPFKVRDKGVIRKTVDVEEGRGLLVTYTSGGVTPGDSYLWILDENGFPISWRLWTSNIPVGGLEMSWGGWRQFENVWFSTLHTSQVIDLEISDLAVSY
ncbi:MAG: hypothetical protein AAF789_12860 [Bacteroidota bacterium]